MFRWIFKNILFCVIQGETPQQIGNFDPFHRRENYHRGSVVALSAEIVFLAATNDPSSASDATACRCIAYAELWCHHSTVPKSQTAPLQSSPENRSLLFFHKLVSCVASYWWI